MESEHLLQLPTILSKYYESFTLIMEPDTHKWSVSVFVHSGFALDYTFVIIKFNYTLKLIIMLRD